jgi:tetratricopeptide (TPR) repeat protein
MSCRSAICTSVPLIRPAPIGVGYARSFIMQRCAILVFGLAFTIGCGQQQAPNAQPPAQTIVVVMQQPPKDDTDPKRRIDPNDIGRVPPVEPKIEPQPTGLTAQERYDLAVARAFQLLAEKKEDEALAALQQAQTVQDTDFVKGEIERLKARIARDAIIDRTVQDIKTVLSSGRPAEAAKLASDALEQFGDSDAADDLTQLKRQADALLTTQLEDKARKQRFIDEAEAARKAMNYRAALVAYDQAVANQTDVTDYKEHYDKLRERIAVYDQQRTRAAELRRDAYKLDEAIVALEEARKAWDTPQIVKEIDECRFALQNRRDRLAVADFEVIGDVGIPLVGRAIADDLLPHFKARFDLVERGQIASIVQELKLNADEIHLNEQGRSEIGRLVKARYLVVGSVSRLYGLGINARLVDVQTGLIVQTAKIVAGNPRELSAKMKTLAAILMMSDEQKILHEQELAQAATIAPPAVVEIPRAPEPPAPEVVVEPIVVYTPRPPEFGDIVIDDFGRVLPPPQQPSVVVIVDNAPWRSRAVFVALEVGDNLFRRGLYRDAMRHFEFAMSLSPGHADIRFRVDRCRPFLPPPPIVIVPPRPRLAVLPFVEIGPRGFVPPGSGMWTADAIAPYFAAYYDVIDRGEVYWWMGRLGLTLRDVLIDPSARLCLARAMGLRYFLMGNLRDTASFDVTTRLIDAEFNALVGSGAVHVRNTYELKLRLGELTRLTLLPPERRAVFVRETVIVEERVQTAQLQFSNGKFSIAIGIYKDVLKTRPDSVQIRFQLAEAERRQRQWEMEEARRQAFEREQARIRAEQQRQLALAAEAERQRLEAERLAAARAEDDRIVLAQRQQQAHVQLVIQGRNAAKSRNFVVAINLFESAHSMNRSPEVANELAQLRAQAAEAERQRIVQAQLAQQAALQQQREREFEQARQALAAEQQRRAQEELARRKSEEAQVNATYQRLLDQAEQAKAKGQFDVAVSALQSARQLKPSGEIDRLVTAALVDQARADAAKKGEEEKKKLEQQLTLEKERRQQAELKAAENKAKYDTAIRLARAAMKEKKFAEAKQQFVVASQTLRTDEAINGVKQADDELASAQAALQAAQRATEEKKQKVLQVQTLIADARKAVAAKQFDQALQLLKNATTIDPANVETQSEAIKVRQAREDYLAALRKQKDDLDKQASFQKLLDAGKANVAAKQYDAAIVSLNDALKLKPGDPVALAALKDAQARQAEMVGNAQAAAEAKKKRDAYEQHMQRGRTALNLKNWDAAIEAFKAAQATLPGDTASAQLIKDAEKARADADNTNAVRMKAAALAQALERARAAIKLNKFDEAAAAIVDAGKIDPASADLKKVQQDLADARNTFAANQKQAALQKAFDTAIAEARNAIAAKKFDEADKALAQAKQLMPNDPVLARLQQEIAAGRKALAANMAKDQLQAELDKAVNAGRAALNAKKFAEAVQHFTAALKIKPDRAVDGLLTEAKKGQAAQAAEEQRAKLLMAYNDAMKAAQGLLLAKKYDDALKSANLALQLVPNDPAAAQLVKQIEKAKSDAAAMQAEAIRQQNYATAIRTGQALMAQKQYTQAVNAFTEALKHAPNDPAATKALAEARAALNPPKKDPPKVDPPKTDPNVAAYNQNIVGARAAFNAKNYTEAIRLATEALKFKPNDGEATKIVNDARAALTPPKKDPPKVEPPKADPQKQLNAILANAAALETQSKYDDAMKQYQEALKLAPGNPELKKKVDFTKAMTDSIRDLQAGKFGEAIIGFDLASKMYPNDANAKRYLQMAKEKKK